MSLRHGLLGLLNYGSNTGYELDKIFKDSLNFFWKVQTSQLYRELAAMEESGLLTSELIYQTSSPNKKKYSITEAGKAELHHWLTTDDSDTKHETRNAFLMKIFFSGEATPEEAIILLEKFSQKNRNLLRSTEEINASIERYGQRVAEKNTLYWKFVADYGKRIRQVNAEWAAACIEEIKAMK